MTTFAEHAANLNSASGTAAISTKEVRTRIAEELATVYDIQAYRSPTTAIELPCVMLFAGGGRDHREQVGFEQQKVVWSLVFMTTGDEDDMADWFDDILDTIATTLLGVDTGVGTGDLSIDRIREPIEARTGSTEVMALRVELSTIRSTC